MAKRLCASVKEDEHRKEAPGYLKKVDAPKHMCERCGRVANKSKHLCKPEKFKKLQ